MSHTHTLTVEYNSAPAFTFDSSKVEISGAVAQLVLQQGALTFTEDFADDTGFTYDAARSEFSGGQVQQLSQRPTDATFGATYTTSIDGSWGDGVLTGTGNGSPTISSNRLDVTGGLKWVDYAGAGNADTAIQQLAVKMKYTPNYTGKPPAFSGIWTICKAAGDIDNRVEFRHSSSAGQLQLRMNNASGGSIGTWTAANWLPTAGQEYEIEVNCDFDTGALNIIIDGVVFDSTTGFTGTRDSGIGLVRVGGDYDGSSSQEFFVSDLVIFDTVQHTGGYTPGYTLQETDYLGDTIVLPEFAHASLGTILSLDSATSTEAGAPRYTVCLTGGTYVYWLVSAWVASDGSYAQANDLATLNANIGAIPGISGSTSVGIRVHTTESNTQSSVDNFEIGYTGNTQYPTDNPTIETTTPLSMDELDGFSEVVTASGSDAVRWLLRDGSTLYWWNGSAWAISDGTYAQTNTAAEIEANKAALDISAGASITPRAFLHSDDGTTRPTLTSHTIMYSAFVAAPANPNRCDVYGYAIDTEGQLLPNARVRVTHGGFLHGDFLVSGVERVEITDSNGYFEFDLVETATISLSPYTIEILSEGTHSKVEQTWTGVQIPNEVIRSLASIVNP